MSDKMWGKDNPDPGGTDRTGSSVQELSELKDQNEQQLVLIAQLKEMLRKEQSSVSQDKVEEYVNTLNRARAKRSKLKKESGSSSSSSTTATVNIDAIKKEKINLLRQQLEENKAKLAERGKSQKGIEEMVTQLQAQLKDTSTSSSLNVSVINSEDKNIDYNESSSQKELFNILLIKEKKITELSAKSQKLEGTVLDLQENLKEKDSVLDARTKAITLMTESLSKKGKHTLDELDETKEQMRKMQQDFVTLEAEMKARQLTLLSDLKLKNYEISELKEHITSLERKNIELEQCKYVPLESDNNVELMQRDILIEKLQSENKTLTEKIKNIEETQLKVLSENKTRDDEQNVLEELEKLKMENHKLISKINDMKISNEDKLKTIKDENKSLTNENEKNLFKIKELENQLEDALTELKLLKNSGMGGTTKSVEQENQEIAKLKKQLDEANKNMIKTRAIQKGKIKELNKKLDQFRKMNDANALIGQLQNDIVKLNEKIAELEDEKGNMQLKMVESANSSKEDDATKQLDDTFAKHIEEKDKAIQILETELLDLKAQLNQKNLEEIQITSQVSSEMSSICYEEQIDTLNNEKKKLLDQLETLNIEKESILEELELMKKEKSEINAKLETYIQENMDLIDKLEKLSAEKVSSAESIEIVEGLTQQEKLELAAYQKHLSPDETLKCPEDDPPAELDESVQQLSEDTAELLQRIEMFTQERKEVMQKMENLKEENTHLNNKLKEIENNRDILEETYEQLQNEKELLEKQLVEKIPESLEILQNKYESLKQENEGLRTSLKQLDNVNQEKFNLEENFKDLVDNNSSLETKLNSNLDEINNYQLIIEENKEELIHSADTITKLQSQLEERENDIQELKMNISELRGVISELQEQETLENLQKQLADKDQTITTLQHQLSFKENEIKVLQFNINELQEVIRELQENQMSERELIIKLQSEVEDRNKNIHDLQRNISELKSTVVELHGNNLEDKLKNSTETIEKLQNELSEREKNTEELQANIIELQSMINEMHAKQTNIEVMENELDQLKSSLTHHIEEASKIQELQTLLENQQSEIEKLRKEIANKDEIITSLHKDIEERNQSFKVISGDIKDKYLRLQNQLENNEAHVLELTNKNKEQLEKMKKIAANLKKKTVAYQELEAELNRVKQQETGFKINELELQLETSEAELSRFKQKVDKLQQEIENLQQINSELHISNTDLTEKLNLTSNSFKEKSLLEDQLELRLAEVTANDEALIKQLEEVKEEREQLINRNAELEELIKKLKVKLKKAHDKVTELKGLEDTLQESENNNKQLKAQITVLEEHHKLILDQNDACKSDYEKIESDYQIQLEQLSKAKNDLIMDNEKLLEKVQELNLEIDQYKCHIIEIEQSNGEEINQFQVELQNSSKDLQASKEEQERIRHQLNLEVGKLKSRIEELECNLQESNKKLRHSAADIENLKQENHNLSQEIKGLEFAKAALEASCEASQKLEPKRDSQKLLDPAAELILSNFEHVSGKTDESICENPLFDAFKQPQVTSSSIFDSFAEEKSVPIQSSFHVPQQSFDFSLAQPNTQSTIDNLQGVPSTHQASIEDGRDALLKKIKTLEFLLYNTDREKEIALDQCTELVSEMTKIICQESKGEQIEPQQDSVRLSQNPDEMELESQILTDDNLDRCATPPFAPTSKLSGEQAHSVVEEIIEPKKAYICFDDEGQTLKVMEENDDGWGWGPEEARLEQEHMNTLENLPHMKNLLKEITQLKENVKILHMERETYLEEINQLQIKSAKLLKKCKELKAKGNSRKVDDGLDDTILEELKHQISSLEKKIKEISSEYEKEKGERASLANKLEAVTRANEKITESKQILDSEVLRWKRLYQEAQDKFENLDWGTPDVGLQKTDPAIESSAKVKELENIIKDLSLDNEDLQTLLEEQREKIKELNKELQNKITERSHLLQQVDEYEKLCKISGLSEKQNLAENKMEKLKDELNSLASEDIHSPNRRSLEHLEDQVKYLSLELEEELKKKEELEKQVGILTEENRQLKGKQQHLQANLDCLMSEKVILEQKLNNLDIVLQDLNKQIQKDATEKSQLSQEIEELSVKLIEANEMENTSESLKQVESKVLQLQSELEQLTSEKMELILEKNELGQKCEELSQCVQKQIAEKANLLKQIDVLDTANTKMVEMKELQDAEISRLKECEESSKIKDLKESCDDLSMKLETEKNKYSQLKHEMFLLQEELDRLVSEKAILALTAQPSENKLDKELEEKLSIIAHLETTNQNLTLSNEELKLEIAKRDENITELNSIIQTLESEKSALEARITTLNKHLEQTINDLNQTWQIQVDQRGADVAESWKIHLEMVEKDFKAIQSKLQSGLTELEQKNNILLNENSELRKNVDQEISNEIDKISLLQQTISDKDKQIEEIENNMVNCLSELEKLRIEVFDKNQKLSSLHIIVETTQKQFDEKRLVIEEIVSLLEKYSPTSLSYEKQDIIKEIERQLTIIGLKENEIDTLKQNIDDMEKLIAANKREISGLNQIIEDLQKDLSVIHEKEAELVRLNTELCALELVKQEKDSVMLELENLKKEHSGNTREVMELRQCLAEKTDQIKQINLEQAKQDRESINMEFEQLKQNYSSSTKELAEVKQSLHDKNEYIEQLIQQLNDFDERARYDSNKEVEQLRKECDKLKEENLLLQDRLTEIKAQLKETTQKLFQKEQEIQELNGNMMQYYQQNMYYEQEVNRLNGLINEKDIEYNNSLEMLKNNQLSDIQRHYDEILSNKDLDINVLKGQIQELVEANKSDYERFNQAVHEKQDLEQKLAEQNKLLDEDTKQLEELKLVIEDQESRIAQIRKQLFDKSNQYDSLIAEMDVGRIPVTKQPIGGTLESVSQSLSESSDTVSRAELDFVTYILHQRDVRCEELTVEVRQLLEERDTLQLKLSNAIREKEVLNMTVAELRKAVLGEDEKDSSNQAKLTSSEPSTSSPSKSSAIFLAASGTELAKDPLDSNQSLAMKLSELKKVGYKKDKTFVDEQEARRLQQLAVMHEHISEVAKLPPEAAAKLVDASYTLSRDVQSPSKVLLNWLWGKNPPKANES
ncbi:golgin subfamily B member 1-like [Anthonomus grandis grandis]|uniref:golgin subfamily B member 1-like n=1 Tax=Anthonomus grandis grandis TaxID=2921223 RepID=UPI0021662BA8|nr:golgin subfamily B member 1-like [Anthonomus grandis grandis]